MTSTIAAPGAVVDVGAVRGDRRVDLLRDLQRRTVHCRLERAVERRGRIQIGNTGDGAAIAQNAGILNLQAADAAVHADDFHLKFDRAVAAQRQARRVSEVDVVVVIVAVIVGRILRRSVAHCEDNFIDRRRCGGAVVDHIELRTIDIGANLHVGTGSRAGAKIDTEGQTQRVVRIEVNASLLQGHSRVGRGRGDNSVAAGFGAAGNSPCVVVQSGQPLGSGRGCNINRIAGAISSRTLRQQRSCKLEGLGIVDFEVVCAGFRTRNHIVAVDTGKRSACCMTVVHDKRIGRRADGTHDRNIVNAVPAGAGVQKVDFLHCGGCAGGGFSNHTIVVIVATVDCPVSEYCYGEQHCQCQHKR